MEEDFSPCRIRSCDSFLISHELNELRELSDRILVLCNGSLIEPENSKDLKEEELGLWMLGGNTNEERQAP